MNKNIVLASNCGAELSYNAIIFTSDELDEYTKRVIEENNKFINCHWEADENGVYDTTFGNSHIINDGTPAENGMKVCCYCGGSIK